MISPRDELLTQDILRLKKEKSVYIIAHYYQREEVQALADFVGDSYAMAIAAKESPYDVILVAGVDFMAETAAILCPGKIVLTPEPAATCPMANTITVNDVLAYKKKHPESIVVCYVNTPAEIKAVSDVCCTSSNAVKIINRLPENAGIFFIPDQYLGSYLAKKLGRSIDLFSASCPTHANIEKEHLLRLKEQFPHAQVLVHPECHPEIVDLADYAGSTKGILDYATQSEGKSFIIGTECGILYSLQKNNPDKTFILASEELICPNMKSITLDRVRYSLEKLETRVTVPEEIRAKAALALERMIEYAS